MYALDTKQHNLPHIHVDYQGKETVVEIPSGEIIIGEVPASKMKLLQAWIEIHRDELMAAASSRFGISVFRFHAT